MTSASAISNARVASRRNTDFRVFASTSSSCVDGRANASGIAGEPPPLPISIIRAIGCDERFDQQSIDRGRALLLEIQPGQVHLLVPGHQQFEVDLELRRQRWAEHDTSAPGSSNQAVLKLATGHCSETDSADSLPRY